MQLEDLDKLDLLLLADFVEEVLVFRPDDVVLILRSHRPVHHPLQVPQAHLLVDRDEEGGADAAQPSVQV